MRTDKKREHIEKGYTGSGKIHEEGGHTWRMGIYGKGIYVEWRHIRTPDMHGVEINTKRGYRTYMKKKYI